MDTIAVCVGIYFAIGIACAVVGSFWGAVTIIHNLIEKWFHIE